MRVVRRHRLREFERDCVSKREEKKEERREKERKEIGRAHV